MTSKIPIFPVAEIFGPTIQGEGPDIGVPAYFIRFGGCDFRCSWCDSLHAVTPSLVRKLPRLTPQKIRQTLESLPGDATLIVLSGGNPAIYSNLGVVINELLKIPRPGLRLALETQGTKVQPWFAGLSTVVVSPKPPSSGMNQSPESVIEYLQDTRSYLGADRIHVKVVVFNDEDFNYALEILRLDRSRSWNQQRFFFSVGTEARDTTATLLERYRWLIARTTEIGFPNVSVLPQMHVLLWGHRIGV